VEVNAIYRHLSLINKATWLSLTTKALRVVAVKTVCTEISFCLGSRFAVVIMSEPVLNPISGIEEQFCICVQ
jgi:hypothetical protein